MHPLYQTLTGITRPSKTGCRLLGEGSTSMHIYDLNQWTHEQAEALRAVHPRIEISVHASAQSLSGFVVRVREPPPPPYVRLRLLLAGVFLLAGLCVRPSILHLGLLLSPLP